MDIRKLAEEIINGRRLHRGEDLSFFLNADLSALCNGADQIRQALCGDKVDLCTIINGKSGRCSENCKYCAQSAWNHTGCEEYGFLDSEQILAEALSNEKEGVDRFAIVTSGRALEGEDFEKAIEVFTLMNRKCRLGLCASLGLLSDEQFERLWNAGVRSYHENIETSRRNFPNICTTHTYEEKIETIRRAQAHGFCVCSGGIVGMGETWEDRIDMAISLQELGIMSIPVNVLMPIPGTPLENQEKMTEDDILRTIAIFRYINPEANIRLAGGRSTLQNDGRQAFESGVSATITGNMLTTSGSTIASDRAMLTAMGRDVEPAFLKHPGSPGCCGPSCCGPVRKEKAS